MLSGEWIKKLRHSQDGPPLLLSGKHVFPVLKYVCATYLL